MKNKVYTVIVLIFFLLGCGSKEVDNRAEFFPKTELTPNNIPDKDKIWVFILAGQSNMAGRGKVEPIDTIPNSRVLTIDKNENLLVAKEPLHFYEPTMTGLDCGLSFGKELLKHVPDSISVLLIPTAVGASSIRQWISDETFRNVTLFSNFKKKAGIGKKYGKIKGILWHQGETDSSTKEAIASHDKNLGKLFTLFRNETNTPDLPIFLGELGTFSKTDENWRALNSKLKAYSEMDLNAYLIRTNDLNHKGDSVHFDSEGQRKLGKRFAKKFSEIEISSAHNHVNEKQAK